MKEPALAWALTGALALGTPSLPAEAARETLEAREAAATAVDRAKEDRRVVFAGKALKPGQYLWKKGRDGAVTHVVIGLNEQMAYAYDGDELIAVSTISSGTKAYPTPTGVFPI